MVRFDAIYVAICLFHRELISLSVLAIYAFIRVLSECIVYSHTIQTDFFNDVILKCAVCCIRVLASAFPMHAWIDC